MKKLFSVLTLVAGLALASVTSTTAGNVTNPNNPAYDPSQMLCIDYSWVYRFPGTDVFEFTAHGSVRWTLLGVNQDGSYELIAWGVLGPQPKTWDLVTGKNYFSYHITVDDKNGGFTTVHIYR